LRARQETQLDSQWSAAWRRPKSILAENYRNAISKMLFGRKRESAKKFFGDSRPIGGGKRKVAKKLFGYSCE
jgi:hypothetical protein